MGYSEEVNEKSEDAEKSSKSEDESQEAGTVIMFHDDDTHTEQEWEGSNDLE